MNLLGSICILLNLLGFGLSVTNILRQLKDYIQGIHLKSKLELKSGYDEFKKVKVKSNTYVFLSDVKLYQ